ncbi:MAG: glycerate kinase [Bryobacteraceae bacterium]|nr:glycerate kinase [Bryobacteraceae bacterium]
MESTLREHALRIFDAGLRAADPRTGILRAMQREGDTLRVQDSVYHLGQYRRVLCVGAGKASANMATAVEHLLGDRIADGLINTKYGHLADLHKVRLNECGHPVPDEAGVKGASEIARMLDDADEHDLVLVLVSGGGSALLPLPVDGVTLADKQATTSLLLSCGANIHEINAVRKHLSAIKGGQMAARAFPATVVSLILSDVVGDDLDVIASGITAPDRSTFADALAVLDKYELRARVPGAVRSRLEQGGRETPKHGDPVFEKTRNVIVGSNRLALEAAAEEARALGYQTLVLASTIEGEAREIAAVHAAIAREIVMSSQPVPSPACVLSGGEPTVTLRGSGKGGRNQEFALAAAVRMAGLPDCVVLSGGTDGSDGPTDAAGAVASGSTVADATRRGLSARDALDRNDSWTFFDAMGGLIRTGPTGTNVADLQLILVGRK